MDTCDHSLSELLKRKKRFSEPEAKYYLFNIIKAIICLHEKLVIHRDLKLGKIFLNFDLR